MKKNFYWAFLACLTWAGCDVSNFEQVKVLNVPYTPKIVMNGLIRPDSMMSLTVSKPIPAAGSESVLETGLLENAKIEVLEDGKSLGMMLGEAGIYFLTYLPKAGKTYTFKAQAQGYPNAEAMVYLPKKPDLRLLSLKTAHTQEANNPNANPSQNLKARLELQDQGGQKDFYMTHSEGVLADLATEELLYNNRASCWSTSLFFASDQVIPSIGDSSNGAYYCGSYFKRNDATIDGTKQAIEIDIHQYPSYQVSQMKDRRFKMKTIFMFYAINEDLYRYLQTRYLGDPLQDALSEPQNAYSNVKGGLGLIGGLNGYRFEGDWLE